MVSWNYFDKFEEVINKYMPARGEGETMASQIVTAVNKLIYKWYNDGDVYDNHYFLNGWCNDLSDYANWLSEYAKGADEILERIKRAYNDGDYEAILRSLADLCLNEDYLSMYNSPKQGSIYSCEGKFVFVEDWEEDCDDWEEEDDEDE